MSVIVVFLRYKTGKAYLHGYVQNKFQSSTDI